MMESASAEGDEGKANPDRDIGAENKGNHEKNSKADKPESSGAGGREQAEEEATGDKGFDGNPSGNTVERSSTGIENTAEKGPLKESLDSKVVKEDESNEREGIEEEDEEGEEEEEEATVAHPALFRKVADRLSKEPIKVRVHDIKIKGNTKTKDWVIESMLEDLKHAETMQDLLQEAARANVRFQSMGMFEKCAVTLDVGPRELPGTANVIVEVEEAKRPYSGDIGLYSKSEANHGTLEGRVKRKNFLGYAETWDGTGCYGLDTTSELSFGVHVPRVKGWPAAFVSRASVLTQDCHKYSSYKERLSGISVGLVSDEHHDLNYNLTWRDLRDPSHRASREIRRHLGHALLSSIKYTYKIDERNSSIRPTTGFAFSSTTQIAGLGPDSRLLRFARQELECRLAVPLGFYNAALNFGLAAGVILPLGREFWTKSTPISDRFFMGGYTSLVGDFRGPTTLLGFRTRGVGPTCPRRLISDTETTKSQESKAVNRDALGGDLSLTGFTDLSFDLPLRFLRKHEIHGHCFACAGNLIGLTGESCKPFSWRNFVSSLRCTVGAGLVIPSKIFRIEINYCHVLRHQEHDRVKRGFQLCLSSAH
ncbi:hypothetical protein O6H91_13G035000 [Diphasiastrum complanatum]|uniref:Uncharacterized protein n=3 Tax=Diphasiastrum complanatum TaxID=34168 RepID=A0ACC2BTX2_DIPCM|nr:hypothetical protein O6H91_13G035000 [Diphasiastrum complanatum]KAJ7533151.1 hypothetical protein O6H91_13G035000 [Diphasiastrum complanatum]KAJ7533152.1 hypothetical protein O6H91_13G035000 [Diphasiastrum complanatum]